MVVNLRQRNTLHFPYFWNFSKSLQAIFSQLRFENMWLHLLGEVAMTQKSLKMTEEHFKSRGSRKSMN